MATATPFENQFRGIDFVGRQSELAELRAGLDRATSGRTQIFLIGGEPGIGKTRVANEVASAADLLGMRVAWGICCEGAGAPAYWPLIQVARSLLAGSDSSELLTMADPRASQVAKLICDYAPDTAPAANFPQEPEQARFQLFDGFASLLSACAQTRPLLVVLDDLQDADPTSWLMLRFIARELRDVPLMIAVAYRDIETRRSPIATQVISDLLRIGRQLLLSGLSEAEVAEMVENSAGHAADRRFVSALHRTTGGNPFFVSEVVRTLVGTGALNGCAPDESPLTIPESLRTSIRGRLSTLPAHANNVLAAAAALGSEFDLIALQRLTGASLDEMLHVLDLASGAGIALRVEEGRPRYRFSHSLIRDVLHRDLDDATRMELHRKIVGVLEDLYRAEPDRHLDDLAYHSMRSAQAGLAQKAIDYSIRAGEAAYAAFAYEKAARHWRDALALTEEQSAEPLKLARLLERLADALSIIEVEQPVGIDCLERALRLYESAGRPVEAAQAHARLAVMFSTRGPSMNVQRALAEYRQAEQVLGQAPQSESQVWLYNGLAQAAMQAQRTEEGMAASQRGMEIAAHLGKDGLWTVAAAHHSDALFHAGRLAQSLALGDEAWHKADRLDDLRGAFETAWSAGYHLLGLWDPCGGQRWFTRELARPRMAEAAYQRQILLQQVAFGDVFRGRLREALEILNEAPRAVVEGFALIYLGEPDKADRILDEARKAMRAAGSLDGETVCAYFQSLARSALNDLGTAESLVGRVIEASVAGSIVPFELNARSEMALIAVKQGRPDFALEQVKRCREILSSGEDFRGISGRVALAEAVTAAALGACETAAKYFSAAARNFAHYDLAWERAQAEQLWGRALTAAGDPGGAAERFDAAIEIYRRHGAGAMWLDRVQAEKDAAAATPPGTVRRESRLSQSFAVERPGSTVEGTFRHEGDYWTISFRGSVLRLRNTKGLHYLAHLLAHPRERIAAVELARVAHAAKKRGRVVPHSADARASGERSRVRVTKGVKASIAKIRASNAALGRHLATGVKTGSWCVYQPDADDSITWRISKPSR